MSFLYTSPASALEVEDFKRFELLFAGTVRAFLPCSSVSFLARSPVGRGKDDGREPDRETPLPQAWEVGVLMVHRRQRPLVDQERQRIYLPLWQEDTIIAVAIAEGVESLLLQSSQAWLAERSRLISRECRLLKKWAVEPLTGLAGGIAFNEELAVLLEEKKARADSDSPWLTLAFLEVLPGNPRSLRRDIARAAAHLHSLLGEHAPLYHLGSGLFAMVWNGLDQRQSFRVGNTVLGWMKQEELGRCSLGMDTVDIRQASHSGVDLVAWLVDRCRQALDRARRRGPAALCNFAAEDAAGRLAGPPVAVMRQLARQWRGKERFAVILLGQKGPAGTRLSRKLLSLAGEVPFFFGDEPGEAWGILVDAGPSELEAFITRLRQGGRENDCYFLLGVALYPCLGYRKSHIPVNARKALIHASFYGDNGIAVFDDVSLNISGDIYYEEGNLAAAAREYRTGLRLNPDSTNLRNSLGVCYAQMGWDRRAIPLFRRVLELDDTNFMALYNLGLALRQTGREKEALAVFEKARAVDGDHVEVLRQLGELYAGLRRFEPACTCLGKYLERTGRDGQGNGSARTRRRDIVRGRVLYTLADAWLNRGEPGRAVAALEKAVRANPRDGQALGLLAELYADQGQGDEIALSLVRRAVELDEGCAANWRRLAELCHHLGERDEAVAAARKWIEKEPGNREAGVLLEQLGAA